MSRFPGLEEKILKTLEEQGVALPPPGRIAQEWFWQTACQLQARGLCRVDQAAGVVRSPVREVARPANDIRARCELLVQRWRRNPALLQASVDLAEVLGETE